MCQKRNFLKSVSMARLNNSQISNYTKLSRYLFSVIVKGVRPDLDLELNKLLYQVLLIRSKHYMYGK